MDKQSILFLKKKKNTPGRGVFSFFNFSEECFSMDTLHHQLQNYLENSLILILEHDSPVQLLRERFLFLNPDKEPEHNIHTLVYQRQSINVIDSALPQNAEECDNLIFNIALLKHHYRFVLIFSHADEMILERFLKALQCCVFNHKVHSPGAIKQYVKKLKLPKERTLLVSLEGEPIKSSKESLGIQCDEESLVASSLSRYFKEVTPVVFSIKRTLIALFLMLALVIPGLYYGDKFYASYILQGNERRFRIPVLPEITVGKRRQGSFIFDGQLSFVRVLRYQLSKHYNWVPSEEEEDLYKSQVLEYNKLVVNDSILYIPMKGQEIIFPKPKEIDLPERDSSTVALEYFYTMLGDSIVYITDYYYPKETPFHRKHLGLDISARLRSWQYSPISGKATLRESENGGKVIVVANDSMFVLFAHCDKIMFFEGQEVVAKDIVATVGMTGKTSGPHAHIETGIRSKKGTRVYFGKRYKVMDPLEWYYKLVQKE